jgi:4-amino-4-deoxy-L-arabinose transferase-like glycosyltransferase
MLARYAPSIRALGRVRAPAPVLLALAAGAARLLFPERPDDLPGPRALVDLFFSLSLWATVLLLAGGLGLKALRRAGIRPLTPLERAAFSLPLGLGICAYGVLALGLAGWLRPGMILGWLGLLFLLAWREISEIWGRLPGWMAGLAGSWQALDAGGKLFAIGGALVFSLTLFQALTPPWDYDGLMYHLEGPRLFLQAGRILLLPDNWQSNFPFTIEMLFATGLAFGSDSFARLIHLSCAAALVLATYTCGRRLLGPACGKYAALALAGIPALPLWASWANIDIGWALFEFLGVYALLGWLDSGRRSWLGLAGVFSGLALGSKYLALAGGLVVGLMVLRYASRSGPKAALSNGLLFGATALLVGSPWYLKNLILGHNPIYPLYFGGIGWPPERVAWLMAYLDSFGTGRSFWDYLLLPWNLYAQPERFATFFNILELSPLFPLALLSLRDRRSGPLKAIAVFALLRSALWAAGSQQTRMLLPVFPALSLLCGSVLARLAARAAHPAGARAAAGWRRLLSSRHAQLAVDGLAGGALAATVVFSVLQSIYLRPFPVISGLETKAGFLRRVVDDYAAVEYIRTRLPEGSRVLMMWDGQGYYCGERCLASTEQAGWLQRATAAPEVAALSRSLQEQGITHLLFTTSDIIFFREHDPTGKHRWALDFFLEEFRPACTDEIYADRRASLFELTCP